ncbi:MAG: sigma-54 dependent transcriptional regulator [Desulfovermiculus sp.]|nr:sigma-54 dependent transcriptional regulator [Desulfovermiculus sp.]
MNKGRILIVDDEQDILLSLTGILEDEGYEVLISEDGETAWRILQTEEVDLLFLDIWLPGEDGISILEKVRQNSTQLPVIMISGHGNIETAVDSIKKGAFDFIEKPLSLEKVMVTAAKALEFRALQQENLDLRSRVRADYVQDLSGKSLKILELRRQIDRVAPTEAWVLITGDNGTGKEIVARSIHKKSRRAKKPMIAVNCAAIPEELIESELFGHEKGAFTGAEATHAGKFELAHKGTLFLDEIGDMSQKTQAKILRILQEQRFERVGGGRSVSVDVRVIVATNKDLAQEIAAGRFREDLFYRLNVFPLHVPALKERREDIPVLIQEFTQAFCQENGFRPLRLTDEACAFLKAYPWPGNVRELKNFVERMHIMYPGQELGSQDLPPEFWKNLGQSSGTDRESEEGEVDFKNARAEFERRFLRQKLNECQGNVSRLAETVGLERSYLHRKLKSYGIN